KLTNRQEIFPWSKSKAKLPRRRRTPSRKSASQNPTRPRHKIFHRITILQKIIRRAQVMIAVAGISAAAIAEMIVAETVVGSLTGAVDGAAVDARKAVPA